ncbi:MAG: HEAT repeat domain-containing protein [Gammaproteobacteria bacterium]
MPASSSVFDFSPLAAIAAEAPLVAWATVFLFLLTAWMVLEIVIIRIDAAASGRREMAVKQAWEPILFAAALDDELPPLPRLRRRDRVRLLKLWCHTGSQVDGEACDRLAALGRRLTLDRLAQRILQPPSLVLNMPSSVETLLAIQAAERMHVETAWRRLERLVARGPAPLDRAAARALVAIDPERASRAVIPALVRQGRWARHLVEDLFEAGVTDALDAYAALLEEVAEDVIPGLALLIDRCADRRAVGAIRTRLSDPGTQSADAIAALLNSLGALGDRSDVRLVGAFIAHDSWVVRMRAAEALGHCGSRADGATLHSLLQDPNWYTRYHAARAILRLDDLGRSHLHELAARSPDRYARDMARHVLAEAAAPAIH